MKIYNNENPKGISAGSVKTKQRKNDPLALARVLPIELPNDRGQYNGKKIY